MKDFDKKYGMGIELLKKLECKKSFAVFEALALDERNSQEDRAYASSMLEMLVECYDPCLAPGEDESDLEFYKTALALDLANFYALRGVVRYFYDGLPYSRHQATDAFLSVYNNLCQIPESFWKGKLK